MTKQWTKIKEFTNNLSGKVKKVLLLGGGALLCFAVVVAFLLNNKTPADYAVLFTGLSTEEASEVMTKLQENGVDYKYRTDGEVTVPREVVDKARATLAVEGYPKNGFTYETFLNNSNMMSTESDKKSLKVWELQDRLSATIRYIDGVKDAVVQISPGEIQKYVLDNANVAVPTASVMVTMKDGGSPSQEQVAGIQRLVAKSVSNMDMGDVAVIDGNGVDVSIRKNDSQSPSSDAKVDFEKRVQAQVETNILNILGPMYGWNNVKVSARCTADMQKILSEESGYTAPNADQNAGYITRQTLTSDNSNGTAGGGVPGADTNANVPQYNTQAGNAQDNSSASSDTDFALNQKKIQSQNDSATIADLTVAVSINSADLGSAQTELLSLVGNASGIPQPDWTTKITIVNSEWLKTTIDESPTQGDKPAVNSNSIVSKLSYPVIAAIACAVIFLFVLLLLIFRERRRKAARELDEMMEPAFAGLPSAVPLEVRPVPVMTEEDERGREIKSNIKDFTADNPEISAQLLKSWLRGEEDHD